MSKLAQGLRNNKQTKRQRFLSLHLQFIVQVIVGGALTARSSHPNALQGGPGSAISVSVFRDRPFFTDPLKIQSRTHLVGGNPDLAPTPLILRCNWLDAELGDRTQNPLPLGSHQLFCRAVTLRCFCSLGDFGFWTHGNDLPSGCLLSLPPYSPFPLFPSLPLPSVSPSLSSLPFLFLFQRAWGLASRMLG